MKEICRIKRLENEEFKLIPDTRRYFVSNQGRILKIVYDKNANMEIEHLIKPHLAPNKTKKVYSEIFIELLNGEKVNCRLSRAIAKTWIDPTFGLKYKDDKRIVDHINNDSTDNRLCNLRILTQSGNIRAAVYEQGKSVSKPCRKCFAQNGDDYREYLSVNDLVKDITNSKNPGEFHTAMKLKKHLLHGFTVGYLF